jgi:rubrerythrin
MNLFTASDIFKFAIRIEEDGRIFYLKAVDFTDTAGVKNLFLHLADEETRHKRIFQEMLGKAGDYRSPESYAGEYMTYLRDYIDDKVVFKKDLKGTLTDIHDTLAALDFAIKREVDSILYYQEVKQFVPEKHHKFIDDVIAEERNHFKKLTEVKKTINQKT